MVVGAVIVASLLRGFVGQMFLIPSISMENTLQVDDRVVVEKLSGIKRGQVVVFSDPGGWLTGSTARERGPIGKAFQFVGVLPDTSTEHLIKRVIGLPGDHLVCCDAADRLTVNGQALDEASYLGIGPDGVQVQPSAIKFDVVVPHGHLFVMGDNRDHSRDSRCHLNDAQGGATRGRMRSCRTIWSSAARSPSFGPSIAGTACPFRIRLRPFRPASSRRRTSQ